MNEKRILRIAFFIYLCGLLAFWASTLETRSSRKLKEDLYLSPEAVAEESKSLPPGELNRIFEGKYAFYKDKLSSFYLNIRLTAALCVVGCIVLYRDGDLDVPGFPSLKIPIYIAYLIVPAALMYYWMQFGFLLHHLIDARITLNTIVNAQYILNHVGKNNPDDFRYYYTLTRVNDLRDTGFLDSWFISFLPKYFITPALDFGGKIIPTATMLTVGCLYGISHGLCIGLPLNWYVQFKQFKAMYRRLAIGLLGVNLFFILFSHPTFYYTGRNYNSFSFFVLITGLCAATIVVRARRKKERRRQYNTAAPLSV